MHATGYMSTRPAGNAIRLSSDLQTDTTLNGLNYKVLGCTT